MDNPKYVIKSYDSMVIKQYKNQFQKTVRYSIYVILAILLLFRFLLKIDLYGDLPSLSKMTLGIVVVYTLLYAKQTVEVKTPFEISFYDDYIEIYLPKRIYSARLSQKELWKISYADLKSIQYEKETKMLYIYGNIDATWYDYKKDGTLPDLPTKHKYAKDAMVEFTLCNDDAEQIISDLKQYGNITVIDKKTEESLS
ncbi:MAG: hypothetical protein ACI32N_09950 [Bulleidia sp.]